MLGLVRIYHEDRERRVKSEAKEVLLDDLRPDAALRETVRKHLEGELDLGLTAAKEALLSEFKIPKAGHEYRGRFNESYRQLTKLLDQGLEVHPALLKNTPPADVLMPSWKRLGQAARLLSPPEAGGDESSEDADASPNTDDID